MEFKFLKIDPKGWKTESFVTVLVLHLNLQGGDGWTVVFPINVNGSTIGVILQRPLDWPCR